MEIDENGISTTSFVQGHVHFETKIYHNQWIDFKIRFLQK